MMILSHLKKSFALLMILACSGCLKIDDIPITQFRVPFKVGENYYCDIREVTSKRNLASKRIRVGHIDECMNIWGIVAPEFAKTREWLEENDRKAKNVEDFKI